MKPTKDGFPVGTIPCTAAGILVNAKAVVMTHEHAKITTK